MSDYDKSTCPVCFTKMRNIKKVLTCPDCGYKYCDHNRELQNMFDTTHTHASNYTTYTNNSTSYQNTSTQSSANNKNYANTYSSSGKTTYTNTSSGQKSSKKSVGKIVKIIVIIYLLLMFCPVGCGVLFTTIGVLGEMADGENTPEIQISSDLVDEDYSIDDIWEEIDAEAPVAVESADGDFVPELIKHIFDTDSVDEVTNKDISTVYYLEIQPDYDNNLYVYYYTTGDEYGDFLYEGSEFDPKDLDVFFALEYLHTPYTRYEEGDLENLKFLTTLTCQNSPAELADVLDPTQLEDLSLTLPEDVYTLDGLEKFSELTFLKIDASYTTVTDAHQIAALPNLYYLDYTNYTYEADYDFLNDLSNIEYLYLSAPGLTDLSFAENLSQLRSFGLEYNSEVTDLSPLTKVADTLTTLNLIDCPEIKDFSPISDLDNLTYLGVDACQVEDLSFVSDLSDLNSLSICDLTIDTLEPLKNLSDLEYIYAYDTTIDDYAGLEDIVYSY